MTKQLSPDDDALDFVSLTEASAGLGRVAVQRLAEAGSIRTRWRTGDRLRYSRSDAQRLAQPQESHHQ